MNLRNMMSNVASMPKVQEFMQDLKFPVGKAEILDVAQKHGADNTIMSMLQKLPDKQYINSSDLTNELSKLK